MEVYMEDLNYGSAVRYVRKSATPSSHSSMAPYSIPGLEGGEGGDGFAPAPRQHHATVQTADANPVDF